MNPCMTETATLEARTGRLARMAGTVLALAAEIRAGLSRAAMNRRVLQRLSTLSDRELKDIGLTRQDVADACVPGTGDAIHRLIGRRDERRQARGAARRW
ncbi:hypothetical protein A3862_20645 [Methylobacterium sp. XJLW]|jgi:uncharacterized protein YjiS (DUF1127 family)|uniref:Protein of unassigned function n=2 Tax=Methylobacteriaceae TaxID=119045 RepID=A0A089NUI3_9HYPH|nr:MULTISPECIES: DUF1127 domain-containing protein [Methylobacterium]KOX60048.1 hypothetical protein ADL19_03335 [Streptomyces purpurogeneiscleroticus]AIQ90205.1 protein of unassigned function [Methylobacterium oryzae CBMB20]AWV17610.1 hypothetical protein A3862_20645 [Methylobacterium sp. XJLW]MBP31100.1 DUF1127 domain-containing protein [Methylobacterium sp.]WFS09972.1 DUF1127 domain-containing protein [Methylobacterium sp. 391_Methyba4]